MHWSPWRYLRERHPDVEVITADGPLPGGLRGMVTPDGIVLAPRMLQCELLTTLTHEAMHLTRGPVPADPILAEREESIVRELTARLCIPLEHLIDACKWGQGEPDVEELRVDLPTLLVRVRTLTADERDTIEEALRD